MSVLARRGFSAEAASIDREYRKRRQELHRAPSLGDESVAADELLAVWFDSRRSDWDGFGARRVSLHTFAMALRFLGQLPLGYPAPSFGADPDGEITLEWYSGPGRVLSVSVGPTGELSYAARIGNARMHGTDVFFDEVPRMILDLIDRVTTT